MLAKRGHEADLVTTGWTNAGNTIRYRMQNLYSCCGLNSITDQGNYVGIPCNPAYQVPCMPFLVSAFRANFGALGVLAIVLASLLVLTLFFSVVLMKSMQNANQQIETRVDDSRTAGRFRV